MKLEGVTMFSRTMARTPADLRLRRGRALCCTHTPPWLFLATAGLSPAVGSNAAYPRLSSIPFIVRSTGSVFPAPMERTGLLVTWETGAKALAYDAVRARTAAEIFMV